MLQGKSVLVTGASAGIGAAAVRAFVAAGARVTAMARNGQALRDLQAALGPDLAVEVGDVAEWDAVEGGVAAHVARFGRLDILINNAGIIAPIGALADADPALWSRTIDINVKGVFHGMRAAIPLMRAQGGGTIITLSSGAAHQPLEGWSAYCASKAGAAMLTRMAHLEEAEHGLRVMGLSPGTVATAMQVAIRASGINPVSQLDPSVHIPPEWVARCLIWMCGPEADGHVGTEVSLRNEDIRRAVGLID